MVAATIDNIMMVEGEMNEVQESEMLEAIKVAHEAIKVQCKAQLELSEACGKLVKREYCHEVNDDELRKERKEQEEIIEGQAEADKLEMNANIRSNDVDHVTEAQKQIVRIMKDNKMLNEDIKGIDIDLNF